jgi:uncharacterized protein (TIGR00266 family)
MASMSSNIAMSTRFNGGFFKGIFRRIFGKESLFVNEFTAQSAGDVVFTQALPGDMACLELKAGEVMYLQPGAFIACEPTVSLGLGWAGFASWFGGEGLVRLKLTGPGKAWYGAYGGIFEREVSGEYVVDTGHLVGYAPGITIKVGMAGGLFSSLFGGEGFVSRVRGHGKILMQSRSFDGLATWTNGFLY